MSWWRTGAVKRVLIQTVDPLQRIYYWCSKRSPPADPCLVDCGSFMALPLRAGGHCAPDFHRTFSEQDCRNARECINRRYNLFVVGVDAWIVSVTQLFTGSEIRGEKRQNMYN